MPLRRSRKPLPDGSEEFETTMKELSLENLKDTGSEDYEETGNEDTEFRFHTKVAAAICARTLGSPVPSYMKKFSACTSSLPNSPNLTRRHVHFAETANEDFIGGDEDRHGDVTDGSKVTPRRRHGRVSEVTMGTDIVAAVATPPRRRRATTGSHPCPHWLYRASIS